MEILYHLSCYQHPQRVFLAAKERFEVSITCFLSLQGGIAGVSFSIIPRRSAGREGGTRFSRMGWFRLVSSF